MTAAGVDKDDVVQISFSILTSGSFNDSQVRRLAGLPREPGFSILTSGSFNDRTDDEEET